MDKVSDATGNDQLNRISPGDLQLYKDLLHIHLSGTWKISFPNGKDDIMNFHIIISPKTVFIGVFVFDVKVPTMFPQSPPKVSICHPYIDLQGNVLLHTLSHAWNPSMSMNNIVDGIYSLFTSPFASHDDHAFDHSFVKSANFDNANCDSINGEKIFMSKQADLTNVEYTHVFICDLVSICPAVRIRFHDTEVEE
ncbi:hypothetical protein LXL04_015250 [Taraxacum kok-saghyz]